MEIHEHRKLAEVEDGMWYFRSLHRHVLREAQRALAGGRQPVAPRLLDAGCGTGGLLCRLHEAEPRWDLTGLDFSEFACEVARKRCPAARIQQGSTTALPFADASFDLIISADVLCQITEHREALAELFRCLRPGGTLVVNVPAYRWLWSYHDVAVGGRYRFGRGELHRLVGDAGFVGVTSTHWNTLPFPLVVAKRKLMPAATGGASDVRAFPAPVEAVFRGLMAAEHGWIRRVSSLPYGCSILLTARKA